MKTLGLLGLALLGNVVAGSTAMADWNKVFECSRGAVVVDSNSYEPRYLQIVIRDADIVGYLKSQGVRSLQPTGQNEIIFGGLTERVVTSANEAFYLSVVPYGSTDKEAETYRVGNDLKVVFYKTVDPSQGNSDCGTYINCGSPYRTEAANWVFRNCY
jgi:hypothetical protein